MYKDFKTPCGDIELDYFTKERTIFSKTKIKPTGCSKQIILMEDKETKQVVPFQIKCNSWNCEECSSRKAELLKSKLNIIAPQEDFSFFLTLTTKPIYLFYRDQISKSIAKPLIKINNQIIKNAQITIETSNLFKKFNKIMSEYDKSQDLDKIKSRYKYKSIEESQQKYEKIVKNWFNYELIVQLKKISQKEALIRVANQQNTYLKKLSNEQIVHFKQKNEHKIYKEYLEIFEKKREKLLNDQDFIKYKQRWFNEVLNRNQDKQRNYFLIIESTKNNHPHFHILLNRFIPSKIIEQYLDNESKIYKNLDLKEDLENDNKFYNRTVNYILKYLTKSLEGENSTQNLLNSTYKRFRIYYFSKDLYKKYPFLKTKQPPLKEKRFEEVDRVQGKLNHSQPFDPSQYTNNLTRDIAYQKYKTQLTSSEINYSYLNISKYVEETLDPIKTSLEKEKIYTELSHSLKTGFLLSSLVDSKQNKIFPFLPLPRQGRKEKFYDLDTKQLLTLQTLFNNKLTLCLGDGGSGKTTILEELNAQYGDKCKITYCSFTAQACANINKKLQFNQAKTIHKTFNNIFSRNTIKFRHNEGNILKTDILVIDEFTMLDKEIFFNILKGLSPQTHILLLGDEKQISSFKSNSLYHELKNIEGVNIVKLKGQYRANSKTNHKISQIFQNVEIHNKFKENSINEAIMKVLKDKTKKILCNTNDLVQQINKQCLEKDSINRNIKTLSLYDFKIGDIVMNTKNNYSLDNLANGENLTILSYNEENQSLLTQRHINNKIQEIPLKDTFYLVPSYAITIHKAQGSEYEEGIIFIENVKGLQLTNINILYTACSRFRKDFKLYFLDDKAKNKCYNHRANELSKDIVQFQKPKTLLKELDKELISNPLLNFDDPSEI